MPMNEEASKPAGSVASPCVRNCCLDENDICLGCHRSLAEICGWHAASNQEKREILDRCRLRQEQRDSRRNSIRE